MIIKPFVLASQSPRRKELLHQAGLNFEVVVKFFENETYPQTLSVFEVPEYLAHKKAAATLNYLHEAFHGRLEKELVVGADTIVVLDNETLGKPRDAEDAKRTLQKLSGKTHKVITGVAILGKDVDVSFNVVTKVTFNTLSDFHINYYVDTFNPMDKAGSYAIQEWIGLAGIEKINGDYYNVVGLPVSRLLQELSKLNKD